MNDYLWDKSGPPDPEIADLERRLRPFAVDPTTREGTRVLPREPRRPSAPAWLAAAAILLAAIGLIRLELPGVGPYSVEVLEGSVSGARRLAAGGSLRCDEGTRAILHVGDIGSVTLDPSTHVRIEDGRHDEEEGYRLYLEVGTVSASIFSAPRIFQIGTPGGIAVDLGCVYSTTVDEHGRTTLRVKTGAVSFEAEGRSVYVPAFAECPAVPGRGPGTPVFTARDDAFKETVRRIDAAKRPESEDLDLLRRSTDDRDTLTFFHLLDHEDRTTRKTALDGIFTLADDLELEEFDIPAIMRGDRVARKMLRDEIDWRW